MVNFVAINTAQHTNKAWRRPANFLFAANQAIVPLVAAEFGSTALSLPIGFIQQPSGFLPVAVMSPVAGRNLFIGPAGQWLGTYVPSALRTYPFRLSRSEGGEQVTLCIDEDSGLVVEADGVAENFIDPDGKPAAGTKALFDFLVSLEQNRTVTDLAVKALADAGLLQPWRFEVTLDGSATPATDLFRVDEPALNALDDASFLKLRHAGSLALVYLQLISMSQVTVLDHLSLTQQQLRQMEQKQRQMPTPLEEFFAKAKNETLRFN